MLGRLGYGGLGFLSLLLEVSIHCGLHVVPSKFVALTAGCVRPEPTLLVRLCSPGGALISWQFLLKSLLVLFRFVSEAVLLCVPLRLAIHFTEKFI